MVCVPTNCMFQEQTIVIIVPLQSNLCAAPVATLGVILDSIVRLKTDPLWKRAVLPLLLGKGALGAEGFLGRLCNIRRNNKSNRWEEAEG